MDKLEMNNLSFRYKTAGPLILQNANFVLQNHTFNLLFGPSGCGKSTLLKLLAGLYPAYSGHVTAGKVTLDGQDLQLLSKDKRASRLAVLFQNPTDQFAMETVDQEFKFTLENLAIAPSSMDSMIIDALHQVGILSLRYRQFQNLSGGELQKVALAIVLAMNIDIILLDEPFASVDRQSRQEILKLLKHLQEVDGKTILVTDHDLAGYENLIDHLYTFANKTLTAVENRRDVFQHYAENTVDRKFNLPSSTETSKLQLQGVSYQNGQDILLDRVDLSIIKEHLTLLTGANGSGKSTFFKILTGLYDFQGIVTYEEHNILKIKAKDYARKVALVFQDAQTQYLRLSVREEIDLSFKYAQYRKFWTPELISSYLTALNLQGLDEQIVYQLSGGQKKKLQILEMLILGTDVLLMDEPLAGLDLDSVLTVMKIISEVRKQQRQTIIMISHQLTAAVNYFDFHLHLANRKMIYQETIS